MSRRHETTPAGPASERALRAAAAAAAETLLNCYMREGGVWRPIPASDVPHLVEEGDAYLAVMPFPDERSMLLAGIRHLSPIHRHRFRMPVQVAMAGGAPLTVSLDTLAGMLADELGDTGLGDELTAAGTRGPDPTFLLARVRQSVAAVGSFLQARAGEIDALWDAGPLRFIDSEQAGLLGDMAHPTAKSRWEMTPEQVDAYAPETAARFALRWLAVAPELVEHDSAGAQSAPQMVQRLLRDDPAVDAAALDAVLGELGDRVLLPVHPWELEHLRAGGPLAELLESGLAVDLGELGSAVTPTSSVATVYNADWPWQLTFALHVRIADGLSLAGGAELAGAVDAARRLGEVGARASQIAPQLVVLPAPAYLAVRHGGALVEGLSVQLRENRWRSASDADVSAVAILAQDHPYGGPSRLAQIVRRLAAEDGRSEREVAREWFRRFCDVVVAQLVRLHVELGLSLAHDQGRLLLELEGGWPARGVLRGDHRFGEPPAGSACAVEAIVPLAVVNALGFAGLADEAVLLADLRDVLERERERAAGPTTVLDGLLDAPTWQLRAGLRRCLEDQDDLFTTIANPLHGIAR